MTYGSGVSGTTRSTSSIAGNIAAEPEQRPERHVARDQDDATTKTGVARRTAMGWITSIVPTPVPTPRPQRNPANTLQMAPATAAPPHSTSTSGSPVTMRGRPAPGPRP